MGYLPPLPIPRTQRIKLGKSLAFLGYQIIRVNPALIVSITQAEIEVKPEYYATLAVLSGIYQGIVAFALIMVLLFVTRSLNLIFMAIGLGIVVSFFMTMRMLAYPSLLVLRRVKDIEANLLYSLRQILIQVRGGNSLFNAVVSVGDAGYGQISKEFQRAVQEIYAGRSLGDALEEMALRNPSPHLRRAVWQIVNGLRTGADIGNTIEVIVAQFTAEQRVVLQKFSKELGPYAMMYMMITVIFPTLGITLFLIIASLSTIRLNDTVLTLYVLFSAFIQFMFMQLLKQKRPPMKW